MFETIKEIRRIKSIQREVEKTVPRVGDMAPDFELWDVNVTESVRLSDFRDRKPVALIFGSFT